MNNLDQSLNQFKSKDRESFKKDKRENKPVINSRVKRKMTLKTKEQRQRQMGSFTVRKKGKLCCNIRRREQLDDESAEVREARLWQMRDGLAA